MKTKCLICNKKNKEPFVDLKQWIIEKGKDARFGKEKSIHAGCLTGKLFYEQPDGFVYGRISIHKQKRKMNKLSKNNLVYLDNGQVDFKERKKTSAVSNGT